jgi:Fe-S-cluster containining protein
VKHKLPMVVEGHISRVQFMRLDRASRFERTILNKGPMSCSKGCSHCCYYPLYVSIFEGILLYRWLVAHGKWTPSFQESLKKHRDLVSFLAPQVWMLSQIPCPLLDLKTNQCTGHAERPFLCRTTISQQDPDGCKAGNMAQGFGPVPKQEVLKEFHQEEEKLLKLNGVNSVVMTLGQALLLAAKVERGEVDLDHIDFEIYKDYRKDG